ERDRRRRHGERAGPGERRGLQQPRPLGRWPAQAGRHGPGRLPLVRAGIGPRRRRHGLLDPERHEHCHPDSRRQRRPGAPILHGWLVPDRIEVDHGLLHPVSRINDMDLTVTAPDGTTYNGNQYMGFNPGESQPNPTSRDNLNNVESVLVISNVQAGLWTVTVHGFNVPQGPQSFALVLTGGIATEHGVIGLDHHSYQSSATVDIKVVDTGLNLNPNWTDTVQVNMSSDTESK